MLISVVWIILVRFSPFTSRQVAIICAIWLVIAASLAFLPLVLGNRLGKKLIFESSFSQKLRDLILDERHDDFIAHASHELKTPVAIILANAELLLDSPEVEEGNAKLLHAIHRQALRAQNLLESLLDLLRLNAGHYEVKVEKIDLYQFFAELRASLGHMGSIIKNEIREGTYVKTDRMLFERLTHIIIENAQKYAGKNPELAIIAQPADDYLKIQFVDNGPGIKTHLRERVFEKFFRQPEHESPEKDGFGLGLSHARAIVQSLGGSIFVEDSVGQGCTIAVLLDAWPSDGPTVSHTRTSMMTVN